MSQIEIDIKRSSRATDSVLFEKPLELNSTKPLRSKRRMRAMLDQTVKLSPKAQIVIEWESDDLVTRVVTEVLSNFSKL